MVKCCFNSIVKKTKKTANNRKAGNKKQKQQNADKQVKLLYNIPTL